MRIAVFRAVLAAVWAVVAIFTIAIIPTPAGAHAVLVGSSPKDNAVLATPPKKVVLRFDARIEKRVTQVTLLDAKNRKVALPSSQNGYSAGPPNQLIIAMPPLKPGTYRLQYQVMATDGHLTPGIIRFTVTKRRAP